MAQGSTNVPLSFSAERGKSLEATLADRISQSIEFILSWGAIDGGHHKMWTLDQVLRILAGEHYNRLITEYENGEEGPHTYEWDTGIAP